MPTNATTETKKIRNPKKTVIASIPTIWMQGCVVAVSMSTSWSIIFKLKGWTDWSWWWVLSPLWIPSVLVFGLISVALIILLWRDR